MSAILRIHGSSSIPIYMNGEIFSGLHQQLQNVNMLKICGDIRANTTLVANLNAFFPNLVKLNVKSQLIHPAIIRHQFPNLEELIIESCSDRDLNYEDMINNTDLKECFEINPQLKRLSLQNEPFINGGFGIQIPQLLHVMRDSLPNLCELSLDLTGNEEKRSWHDDILHQIVDNLPGLQKLKIEYDSAIKLTEEDIVKICSYSSVTEFSACKSVDDVDSKDYHLLYEDFRNNVILYASIYGFDTRSWDIKFDFVAEDIVTLNITFSKHVFA